jgi:hypothetical protein
MRTHQEPVASGCMNHDQRFLVRSYPNRNMEARWKNPHGHPVALKAGSADFCACLVRPVQPRTLSSRCINGTAESVCLCMEGQTSAIACGLKRELMGSPLSCISPRKSVPPLAAPLEKVGYLPLLFGQIFRRSYNGMVGCSSMQDPFSPLRLSISIANRRDRSRASHFTRSFLDRPCGSGGDCVTSSI